MPKECGCAGFDKNNLSHADVKEQNEKTPCPKCETKHAVFRTKKRGGNSKKTKIKREIIYNPEKKECLDAGTVQDDGDIETYDL